jgi:uncharacterized protein DUF2252
VNIRRASAEYERWLGTHLRIVRSDLKLKHQRMAEAAFPFLRATFYRWAQLLPDQCPGLMNAEHVLGVGDLHVENFGTWRDAEGRLVWGVNDFDEACWLPFTNDLARLATSAMLAVAGRHLAVDGKRAADLILEGYSDALDAGGTPVVLAERHHALRLLATYRLHEAQQFWEKLQAFTTVRQPLRPGVGKLLSRALPERDLGYRVVHRVAGLGSLGRERFVAIAESQGGMVAREAKALAPSAWLWAEGRSSRKIRYQEALDAAVRCLDPFVAVKRRWLVRRLAPDCSRIDLAELPKERDEERLLHAMGWETANVHLGSRSPKRLRADLRRQPRHWLHDAATTLAEVVTKDWKEWKSLPRIGFPSS